MSSDKMSTRGVKLTIIQPKIPATNKRYLNKNTNTDQSISTALTRTYLSSSADVFYSFSKKIDELNNPELHLSRSELSRKYNWSAIFQSCGG